MIYFVVRMTIKKATANTKKITQITLAHVDVTKLSLLVLERIIIFNTKIKNTKAKMVIFKMVNCFSFAVCANKEKMVNKFICNSYV